MWTSPHRRRLPLTLARTELAEPPLHFRETTSFALVNGVFVVLSMENSYGEGDLFAKMPPAGMSDDGSIVLYFID
jgi:hypothetical protein